MTPNKPNHQQRCAQWWRRRRQTQPTARGPPSSHWPHTSTAHRWLASTRSFYPIYLCIIQQNPFIHSSCPSAAICSDPNTRRTFGEPCSSTFRTGYAHQTRIVEISKFKLSNSSKISYFQGYVRRSFLLFFCFAYFSTRHTSSETPAVYKPQWSFNCDVVKYVRRINLPIFHFFRFTAGTSRVGRDRWNNPDANTRKCPNMASRCKLSHTQYILRLGPKPQDVAKQSHWHQVIRLLFLVAKLKRKFAVSVKNNLTHEYVASSFTTYQVMSLIIATDIDHRVFITTSALHVYWAVTTAARLFI
jgi:hypothetical protein